jgi:preprotein translocase subunit SecG
MLIAIYILSFFLVVDCLFLGLLILMQLPKKEAGLGGAAFGGGAVDALIGAGAGNVLTKATKYAAITFFVLIVSLSLLHANNAKKGVLDVTRELSQQGPATPETPVTQPVEFPKLTVSTSTTPATATSPAATNPPATTEPAPEATTPQP